MNKFACTQAPLFENDPHLNNQGSFRLSLIRLAPKFVVLRSNLKMKRLERQC